MRGRLRNGEIAAWLARSAAEVALISVLLLPFEMIALALVVDAAMAERLMRARSAPPAACRLTADAAHCTIFERGAPRTILFTRAGTP